MKIIVVDDESLALDGIMMGLEKVCPTADVRGFRDPVEALEQMKNEPADVAFLDIEMRDISGLELAVKLTGLNPKINIILTTGYKDYMEEAFDIHVSGYIMKPVTPDKLKKELEHLRYPIEDDKKRMIIQQTGGFNLFIDGQAIVFSYQKTNELMAALVEADGTMIETAKLAQILWEDDKDGSAHASYLRNLISDLTTTLKKYDVDDVIVRRRGLIGIDKSKLSQYQ